MKIGQKVWLCIPHFFESRKREEKTGKATWRVFGPIVITGIDGEVIGIEKGLFNHSFFHISFIFSSKEEAILKSFTPCTIQNPYEK